jgi:S1-C subfamily serine protease
MHARRSSRSAAATAVLAALLAASLPAPPGAAPGTVASNQRSIPTGARPLPHRPPLAALHRAVLHPSVKILSAMRSIGSGTIIGHEPNRTWIVTAAHVVAHADPRDLAAEAYLPEGTQRAATRVAARDDLLDLALLEAGPLRAPAAPLPAGAAAAPDILREVLAVGCPAGYDPVATGGRVAGTDVRVRGIPHLLITAPIAEGNSGGGVFLTDPPCWIGVVVRVTLEDEESGRPIPHLALAVPFHTVLDWLRREGFAHVAAGCGSPSVKLPRAPRR